MPTRPERTRSVAIEGRSLHLSEWGDPSAPAVLLIHGIPTRGLLWSDVAPRLAGAARVLAVDLLGYGRSDRPGGWRVDLESHAVYLVRLLDELAVARATVVGHDLGGGVAQLLAVRWPERVARLGLVNSVCYDAWPVPEMRAIQAAAPLVERMPAGLTARGLRAGLRRGFVRPERAEPFLDAFLEPFSTPEGLDVLVEHARALHSGPTEEVAPLLPTLVVPTAVAWGERDPFLPVALAERLAADLPGAELTRVPGASHFAPADAPAPVADALLRLLARPA